MRPSEVRRLAEVFGVEALGAAAEAIEAGEPLPIEVAGDDEGEQLTHLMLAQELRAAVDAGAEPRAAFRAVMQRVRGVLENG